MIEIFYYNHNKFSVAPPLQKSMIHFHELTFLLQGKMVYVIDEQEVPLSSGDAIYVRPGSTRERRPFADSDYISFDELLFLVTMYFRIGNAKKGIPFLSNRYFHAVRIKIDRLFVFAVRVFDFHFILSVKAAESKLACICNDFF